MKKFLFLVSHLGSDLEKLAMVLNANPRIQLNTIGRSYSSPLDLIAATNGPHKFPHRHQAIYGDCILFNHAFSGRTLFNTGMYLYLVRRPLPSIAKLLNQYKHVGINGAIRYYTFRLRRMCEMAKQTPNGILYTWDNLAEFKGFDIAEKYLSLKTPLEVRPNLFKDEVVNLEIEQPVLKKLEDTYERYLYYLRSRLKSPIPI